MKNLNILLFSFGFFSSYLFSYQPLEVGILSQDQFSNSKEELNRQIDRNVGHKIEIMLEKRADGSDSLVFYVKDLSQFLYLATKSDKPLIIKLFAQDRAQRDFYHQIADKLKEDAFFVSIDIAANSSLLQLLTLLLRFEGIDLASAKPDLPLFLFCERDFIILEDNAMHFKKNGLRVLGKPGVNEEDLLVQAIKDEKSKESGIIGLAGGEVGQLLGNENLKESEKNKNVEDESWFKKVKKWFKTKFVE